MGRLLLIGQAPARSMLPGAPALLGTDTFKRLAAYAAMSPRELAERCHTTNVWPEWPGKAQDGKHDVTPPLRSTGPHVEHIRQVILRLHETDDPYAFTHVACLGQWTAKAVLGRLEGTIAYCGSVNCGPFSIYKLFHPGGTNMHLNDQAKRELLATTIRELTGKSDPLSIQDGWYERIRKMLDKRQPRTVGTP